MARKVKAKSVILERMMKLNSDVVRAQDDLKKAFGERHRVLLGTMSVWGKIAALRVRRNKLDELSRRYPREAAKVVLNS